MKEELNQPIIIIPKSVYNNDSLTKGQKMIAGFLVGTAVNKGKKKIIVKNEELKNQTWFSKSYIKKTLDLLEQNNHINIKSHQNDSCVILIKSFPKHLKKIEPKQELTKKKKEQAFEKWRELYDKKRGKKRAKKKFMKFVGKEVSVEKIIESTKKYNKHLKISNTETKYKKYPATWLNQGCWDDEYETLEKNKKKRVKGQFYRPKR